ncbi:MAG: hypothetical protein KF861_19605 [Planctomycetaceae bacterium]|nr:hypothetical protein [Planctomycetaceae bacterium]
MWWHIIVLVLVSVVFAAVTDFLERVRLRKLLDRPCAGIRWHRRFPDVPHAKIREFLRMFVTVFAFDERHSCKFAPDDQPMAIYQARHIPHLTIDDDMEFESLDEMMETRYGIDLYSVWRDGITLGELFAMTRRTEEGPEVVLG